MSDTPDCVAEDDGGQRKSWAVTFAGVLDELARLASDLSEVAQLFDRAMSNDAQAAPTIERMTSHQFFASLLELRRMRVRHFRDEAATSPEHDIVLQLKLARIDGREMTLRELADASPTAIQRHVEQLIEARLAERFENIAEHKNFRVSLSSEAALRLAELYRMRTRG